MNFWLFTVNELQTACEKGKFCFSLSVSSSSHFGYVGGVEKKIFRERSKEEFEKSSLLTIFFSIFELDVSDSFAVLPLPLDKYQVTLQQYCTVKLTVYLPEEI